VASHLDITSGGTLRPQPPGLPTAPSPRLRESLAGPVVAVVALITALVATDAAGARFRDPDNVAAKYFSPSASASCCSSRSTSGSGPPG
jgi:hypothetical protein